jgi:hypothetical protein
MNKYLSMFFLHLSVFRESTFSAPIRREIGGGEGGDECLRNIVRLEI